MQNALLTQLIWSTANDKIFCMDPNRTVSAEELKSNASLKPGDACLYIDPEYMFKAVIGYIHQRNDAGQIYTLSFPGWDSDWNRKIGFEDPRLVSLLNKSDLEKVLLSHPKLADSDKSIWYGVFVTRTGDTKDSTTTINTASTVTAHDKLYSMNVYTDFEIQTSDGSRKVHRAVLAASSPMFHAMFQNKVNEGKNAMTATFPDLTLKTLDMYLKAIYTDVCPTAAVAGTEIIDLVRWSQYAQHTPLVKVLLKLFTKPSKKDEYFAIVQLVKELKQDPELKTDLVAIETMLVSVLMQHREFLFE